MEEKEEIRMKKEEEIRMKKEIGELKELLQEAKEENKNMAAAYASQAEEYNFIFFLFSASCYFFLLVHSIALHACSAHIY